MNTTSEMPSGPSVAPTSVRVDGARLWRSLMDLAQLGATPRGGVRRLALTDIDRQARDLVVGWLRETDAEIEVDAAGNIFATRHGRSDAAAVVLTGSHIDTQPSGGKFDGNYGVLAGLEVLRTLKDADIVTENPVGVAIWTNEEGSRFVPVMGGSGAFAGVFTLEHLLRQRDGDGITFGEALERIGYAGTAPVGKRRLDAYFEAHIEQGPVLEREDKVIGVVTGALGLRWYDCIWSGQDAHAGPTPMEARRDALRGASRMVEAVHALAVRHAPDGRGTVGFMHVGPNSRNVIPGLVKMTCDIRMTRISLPWTASSATPLRLSPMTFALNAPCNRSTTSQRRVSTLAASTRFAPRPEHLATRIARWSAAPAMTRSMLHAWRPLR